jgi:uncharacterized protein YjbJ (UPF0337 family)
MNKDQVEGSWRQFEGVLKERWGHLTGDDTAVIAGIRERIEGSLQERHGYATNSAHDEPQLEDVDRLKTLDASVDSAFGDLRAALEERGGTAFRPIHVPHR